VTILNYSLVRIVAAFEISIMAELMGLSNEWPLQHSPGLEYSLLPSSTSKVDPPLLPL